MELGKALGINGRMDQEETKERNVRLYNITWFLVFFRNIWGGVWAKITPHTNSPMAKGFRFNDEPDHGKVLQMKGQLPTKNLQKIGRTTLDQL